MEGFGLETQVLTSPGASRERWTREARPVRAPGPFQLALPASFAGAGTGAGPGFPEFFK
jgi:hypothetical protein